MEQHAFSNNQLHNVSSITDHVSGDYAKILQLWSATIVLLQGVNF